MTDPIDLVKIIPFAWPYEYLAPLEKAAATQPRRHPSVADEPAYPGRRLASTAVRDLLEYAAQIMLDAALAQDTTPAQSGHLIGAHAIYTHAAGMVRDMILDEEGGYVDAKEYPDLWGVIASGDTVAALGWWGHLNVCHTLTVAGISLQ